MMLLQVNVFYIKGPNWGKRKTVLFTFSLVSVFFRVSIYNPNVCRDYSSRLLDPDLPLYNDWKIFNADSRSRNTE